VEHTVNLVVRLIALANLPLMRPLIRTTLTLLAELRDQNSPTNAISTSSE